MEKPIVTLSARLKEARSFTREQIALLIKAARESDGGEQTEKIIDAVYHTSRQRDQISARLEVTITHLMGRYGISREELMLALEYPLIIAELRDNLDPEITRPYDEAWDEALRLNTAPIQ